ncbi:MAG: hemerythrin domain-containing protein [Candidatus Thermoplasmatota archaeon]|nr:hemerythrin domain-containing protein [Candidatus Thermoplasmatota archaeon]
MPFQPVEKSIFSSDHHILVRMVSRLAMNEGTGEVMKSALLKLRRKMLLHFFREETYLFPSIQTFVSHAFVLGLLTEHAGMLRMIDKILAYIEKGDLERTSDRMTGLMRLLLVHCQREEREIYSVPELSGKIYEIDQKARKDRMPEGWKCAITAKYERR